MKPAVAFVLCRYSAIKNVVFSGVVLFGLLGCAAAPFSSSSALPASPAVLAAQRLEQRAAQAFTQSEWASAQADYQTAAGVYASLALTDAHLRALLNLARVQAESGQPAAALGTVQEVLQRMEVAGQDSTKLIAHGRAAALLLASDTPAAQRHWQQAHTLCAAQCPQRAALSVLEARLALHSGDAVAAFNAATLALQANPAPVERANALRVRAHAALALHQFDSAMEDAKTALGLDQGLGLSGKVVEDLRSLVDIFQALGNAAPLAHYQALLAQTLAARRALQREPVVPPVALPAGAV